MNDNLTPQTILARTARDIALAPNPIERFGHALVLTIVLAVEAQVRRTKVVSCS